MHEHTSEHIIEYALNVHKLEEEKTVSMISIVDVTEVDALDWKHLCAALLCHKSNNTVANEQKMNRYHQSVGPQAELI